MSDAEKKLVEDNMSLVYAVLHKFFPRNAYDEDLQQVGMLALCGAAKKFDPEKGAFSTYAISQVKWSILNEIKSRAKSNKDLSLNKEIHGEDGETYQFQDNIQGDDEFGLMELENIKDSTDLTDYEKLILELRIAGYTCKEIGNVLKRSESYVKRKYDKVKYKIKAEEKEWN